MHSMHEEEKEKIQELDGLAQLQASIQKGIRAGMLKALDIHCVEVQKGVVTFEGIPSERFYNPGGISHGGYAATLLDCACGGAVYSSLRADQGCTTVELKISYHKPILQETGPVFAQGRVLSIGRRVGFATAEITDANGKLYASASSTLLITDKNSKSSGSYK